MYAGQIAAALRAMITGSENGGLTNIDPWKLPLNEEQARWLLGELQVIESHYEMVTKG